ncbi:hypothetical protein AX16_007348 [Volvariella volvacea WC 439]|nr:hypothetical protein AX16_007348 [Volvariella volvacea WC 439]
MPAIHTMSFINHFPPEIISIIVQYLHDDPKSLVACSRVSKAWVAPTRKHLFHKINLRPKSYRQYFNLQQNPHSTIVSSKCVRSLTLRQHRSNQNQNRWSPSSYRSSNSKNWPWVAEHLPAMTGYTKLRELTLEYVTDIDSPYLHFSPLHMSLSANFSTVTRLMLYEPVFSPFSLLIATITSLPNLQSLSLDGGSWPEDDDIPPPSQYTLPASLTTLYLSLEDQMLYDVLCWLNQFSSSELPKIHTLTLGQPTSIDVCDASAEFITALGPSLVNLTLLWFADLGRVRLSSNTSLRTLFIDGIDLINIPPLLLSPLDWGAQTISTIISTQLEYIVFGFFMNNLESLDQLEWCEMKDSLKALKKRLGANVVGAGAGAGGAGRCAGVVQDQPSAKSGFNTKSSAKTGNHNHHHMASTATPTPECSSVRWNLPKIRFIAGPLLDDEVRKEAARRLGVF